MDRADFEAMGTDEIRTKNKAIVLTTRENAAWIGALWHEIEQRSLWRDWGHPSFVEAVVEDAPRAYSSVRECIINYRHFVIECHLSFDEFLKLVTTHGMRMVSRIRQAENSGEEEDFITQAEDQVLADHADQPRVAEGGLLSIVPKLWEWVTRRYRWSPDQDALVQQAIAHIKRRCHRTISDDQALALLAAEYCSEKAVREPIPFREAA